MMTPSQTDTSDEDLMTGRPQTQQKGTGMKERVIRVKFCPKCGSTNIQWASGLPQLWSIWECKDCSYRGAFIVEDSNLAEKIRERFLIAREQANPSKI